MSDVPYRASLVGTKEFGEKVKALVDGLYDDEASKVYLAGAKVIAQEARRLAPVGKHPAFSQRGGTGSLYQKVPGRLRRAIVARSWRQSSDARRRFGPGAYAQVNLKRNKGTTAPYGHIVAGGRRAVTKASGFFFWREGSGGRDFVKTRKVSGFAGRDYFQRAVATKSAQVLSRATDEVRRQIERRAK